MALDELDLQMEEGVITGLIGANGAGKTTFFNLTTGVLKPTTGSVYFKGEEVTGEKPHEICRRGISRTFQSPRPFTELSVEENLRIARHFGPADRNAETAFSVEDLLDLFDLRETRDRSPENLQFVEQKYLDLARALLTGPSLVLLDEIMAGLNPSEKDELISHIVQLHEDHGIEFLVIEHDLSVIRRICDKIVVIDNGRFLASGKPDKIMNDSRVQEAYIA
ncbi:ABC transporter ATP-binding protein [Halorarum halobium]|uniref:ABC transporter ATP-binding protein n=1 Tax=Halorarum halobium TaxID=3075121 RepID=UPI0028B0CF75|nr:ABC transporter ATP-binding protein [Halobaculum sp. XH14]